jgi:hypothetical protein
VQEIAETLLHGLPESQHLASCAQLPLPKRADWLPGTSVISRSSMLCAAGYRGWQCGRGDGDAGLDGDLAGVGVHDDLGGLAGVRRADLQGTPT